MAGQSGKARGQDVKQSLLQRAVKLHQSGQLQTAEQLYRQILQAEPRHTATLYLLALLHKQTGDHETAGQLLKQALEIDPVNAGAWVNLGHTHNELGRLDEALSAYQRALEINPRSTQAYNNLGNTLRELGRVDDAVAAYQSALAIDPDYLQGLINLGVTLQEQRKLNDAAAAYERALEIDPHNVDARYNLAKLLKEQGKLHEAFVAYQEVLTIKPDFAEAYNNLGNVLNNQHKLGEAVTAYKKALALKSDFPEAHYNLGNVLKEQGKFDEAYASYRQALALKPDFAAAYNHLGLVLQHHTKLAEAIAAYRRALELKSDSAEAHCNLGNALGHQGKLTEAMAAYRQALTLKPDFAFAHSNLFFCMHYTSAYDADTIFTEARKFNATHAHPLAVQIRPHDNDRAPERRLRIGYVSAHLRRHPVGFFFAPVIAAHDKEQFEVICYAGVLRSDAITKRFAKHADHWREIARTDDDALAALIRADRIDILVDLAGHTDGNRLLAFARKPAPGQVVGGGHYDTTGLDVMDYLLSDRVHTPPGSDRYFSEELVRLPNGYVCYGPPDYAPPVTESPALERGYITFGCFNNLAKITPQVIALWAEILQALPNARMRLRTHGLDDAATQAHYRAQFESHGIDSSRLELAGPLPPPALLADYGTIDIALDPFPYSG
jgi:predicted O-linked N-acetylglucosamine transferase (SPINDLY family)